MKLQHTRQRYVQIVEVTIATGQTQYHLQPLCALLKICVTLAMNFMIALVMVGLVIMEIIQQSTL